MLTDSDAIPDCVASEKDTNTYVDKATKQQASSDYVPLKKDQETNDDKGSSTLAEGDHVDVEFAKSYVDAMAGVRNHWGKVVYNITNFASEASPAKHENTLKHIDDTSSRVRDHVNVHELIAVVNGNTRRETEHGIVDDFMYEDLNEPRFQVSPQMRRVNAGDYYKGRYIQPNQESDFHHRRVGGNELISFEELTALILKCLKFGLEEQSEVIAIVAPMGFGKSTLMRRIAREALSNTYIKKTYGEMSFQTKMIHYIDMNSIPNDKSVTPSHLLFGGIFNSDTKRDQVYEWLMENQEDAILIFDGLDQANLDLRGVKERKIREFESASTSTIVYNILSRQILRNVGIVVSSREFGISELPAKARPRNIIVLTGLTEQYAQRLFVTLIGTKGTDVWRDVSLMSPEALHFMSIPLCLVVIAALMGKHIDGAPNTATELYYAILSTLAGLRNVRNHSAIFTIITKLKPMAYQGMRDGRNMFSKANLDEFDISEEEVHDLMMKVPGENIFSYHLTDEDFTYSFFQRGVQEFLAAMFVAEMQFEEFRHCIDHDHSEERWPLVRSLTAGVVFMQSPSKLHTISDQKKKQELLAGYFLSQLEKYTGDDNKNRRLELYTAIHESNNEDLIRNISVIDVSNISLSRHEALIVGSLAARSGGLRSLNLQFCQIEDEIIEIVGHCIKDHQIHVENLDFQNNSITAEALRSFLGYGRDESLRASVDWGVIQISVNSRYVTLTNDNEFISIGGDDVVGIFSKKDSSLTVKAGHIFTSVVYLGILLQPDIMKLPDHQFHIVQDDLRKASATNFEKISTMTLDCTEATAIDWSLIKASVEKYKVKTLDVAINAGTTSPEEWKKISKHRDEISSYGVDVNIQWLYEIQNAEDALFMHDDYKQKSFGYVISVLTYPASLDEILNIITNCNSKKLTLMSQFHGNMLNDTELGTIQAHSRSRGLDTTVLLDLEIPSETVTVFVGRSAREIEVGGCSVRFAADSFNEVEEVTVRSEINPMEYPRGREAIAPTLTIHAPNLRVSATVKLHTWCMAEGCEDEIDIMRFDDKTMIWEKIDCDIVVDCNFITFNRSQFSPVGAFCKTGNSSSKMSYFMTPLVYYMDEGYSLALIARNRLMKKRLERCMRKDYGKNVKRHRFATYRFKSKNRINMSISCPNHPNSYFMPDATFDKRIRDIKRNEPEPVFRKYTLENIPPTSDAISIQWELKKDGEQYDVGSFHPFKRASRTSTAAEKPSGSKYIYIKTMKLTARNVLTDHAKLKEDHDGTHESIHSNQT